MNKLTASILLSATIMSSDINEAQGEEKYKYLGDKVFQKDKDGVYSLIGNKSTFKTELQKINQELERIKNRLLELDIQEENLKNK